MSARLLRLLSQLMLKLCRKLNTENRIDVGGVFVPISLIPLYIVGLVQKFRGRIKVEWIFANEKDIVDTCRNALRGGFLLAKRLLCI